MNRRAFIEKACGLALSLALPASVISETFIQESMTPGHIEDTPDGVWKGVGIKKGKCIICIREDI